MLKVLLEKIEKYKNKNIDIEYIFINEKGEKYEISKNI